MTYTQNNNPENTPNLQKGKVTMELSKDMIKTICEMFDEGVPYQEVAEWLGLSKVTVKEVLVQVFPTDIYGILLPQHQSKGGDITLPKLTEPDLFACQLALLVSIGDNAVNEFFETVRQYYPDVTLVSDIRRQKTFVRLPYYKHKRSYP